MIDRNLLCEWLRICKKLKELIENDSMEVGACLNGNPLTDYQDVTNRELELLGRCERHFERMW